jgi:D-3-phosphoglycerate dehydrogenase
MARREFRVGVTRDFLNPEGRVGFGDIGLGLLDNAPGVSWEFLPQNTEELGPHQVRGYDALLVLAPSVTVRSLEDAGRLAVIARFGVGYDNVDIQACSRAGVIVTITPDGVRRPVAAAAITFLLALAHRLLEKDRLTREARWAEKLMYMGTGTTGRTLGVIGLGNIGREVFRLASSFGMRHIAFDPYVSAEAAASVGAELIGLETLMCESDYVVICCVLTDETRHMVNARRLALMKQGAYLINVARGPIVDEAALIRVLQERRIAGAGLDVFEREPPDPGNPLFKLDNVILTPHAVCWTDECFAGNGRSAVGSILEVAAGRLPGNIVNREAAAGERFLAKLRRYGARV